MAKEVCICAAWMTTEGIAVRGHRHCYCRDTAIAMNLTPRRDRDAQGFITSTGRFVTRREGAILHGVPQLFSEDLY